MRGQVLSTRHRFYQRHAHIGHISLFCSNSSLQHSVTPECRVRILGLASKIGSFLGPNWDFGHHIRWLNSVGHRETRTCQYNGTGLISVGQSHIRDNQDVTNSLCHTVKGNKKCLWQQTEVRLKNAFHIVNKSSNRPEMTPRNHPKWQALWFYQSLFIFSDFFTESWFSRNWIRAKFQTQGLSITLYKLTYNWLAHSFNELNCQQKIRAFTAFLHSLVKWRKRRLWTKRGT